VQVRSAASPVSNDEYRGFFEPVSFNSISEIEILKQLEWSRNDDHKKSKQQPKDFAGVYLAHRKYSEKIGNSAAY
jgi:hypothetical protein